MGMKLSEEADVDDKESERKRQRKEKKMLKKGEVFWRRNNNWKRRAKMKLGGEWRRRVTM
jgi:hypothetical protein